MVAVSITRTDVTAADLRAAAVRAEIAHVARRALAIAMVLDEAWVQAGPTLETDGVVRWRRIDLAARIKAVFVITLDVSTVGGLLRKLRLRRISARPQHPLSDEAAQAPAPSASLI